MKNFNFKFFITIIIIIIIIITERQFPWSPWLKAPAN